MKEAGQVSWQYAWNLLSCILSPRGVRCWDRYQHHRYWYFLFKFDIMANFCSLGIFVGFFTLKCFVKTSDRTWTMFIHPQNTAKMEKHICVHCFWHKCKNDNFRTNQNKTFFLFRSSWEEVKFKLEAWKYWSHHTNIDLTLKPTWYRYCQYFWSICPSLLFIF